MKITLTSLELHFHLYLMRVKQLLTQENETTQNNEEARLQYIKQTNAILTWNLKTKDTATDLNVDGIKKRYNNKLYSQRLSDNHDMQ